MRRPGATLLIALVIVPALAAAAPPRATSWESEIAQGAAIGLGFLDAGFIVLGTGDAALIPGLPGATCAAENEDADLYLFTFPGGDGCVQSIDTSGTLGQEGVTAVSVASAANRVTVGLPSSSATGEASNVAVYDLEGAELVRSHVARAVGRVISIRNDPAGLRTAVASVDTAGSTTAHRLSIFDPSGVRTGSFSTPGPVLDLFVSASGRFVAAGGNFSQEGGEFGWANLYDLSLTAGQNPVLAERILEAGTGVVTSVAVPDDGRLFVGTAAGRALYLRPDALALDVGVGEGDTFLDTNADGSVLFAGAGPNVARLGGLPDAFEAIWDATLNATVRDVAVRDVYAFAEASGLSAFDLDGHLLWETAGGAVFGAAGSGLGVALAETQPGSPTAPSLATLRAGVLDANLSATQLGDAPTVSPGDIGVINLRVKNIGAAIVNATLEFDAPAGVLAELFPPYVVLRPEEQRELAVHATVSGQARPGEQRIPFSLLTVPASNGTGNLTLRVGETTRIALELQPGTLPRHSVVQGQNVSLAFAVRNSGNTDASTQIEVVQFPTQGRAWPIDIEPSSRITVQRDSVTTVVVDIEVPDTVPDGTRNRFVVRALAGGGASAAAVDFLVNPFEALDVRPRLATRLLGPGTGASFDYVVENLGSVASNITLLATALDEEGRPVVLSEWTVDVDKRVARLGPGAEVALQVAVSAPVEAVDGESLRIQLLARTGDGVQVSAIGFAHVEEDLRPPAPEEPKREPLPLIVPLAALAAGAFLRRRGHYGKP